MAQYSELNLDEPAEQWTVAWRRLDFNNGLLVLRALPLCYHCRFGESTTVASMTISPRKVKVIAGFLRPALTTRLILIRAD